MAEKTRYSDEELQEFKELILEKLEKAKRDYEVLKASISGSDGNDIADTSPTFKVLEEGASVLSKEEAGRLAQRQAKFIAHLEAALVRIENKTYKNEHGEKANYFYHRPSSYRPGSEDLDQDAHDDRG